MQHVNFMGVLARRWPIILLITAIVFGAAYWSNGRKAPSYFGSYSITVQANRVYPDSTQLILQPKASDDLQTAIATTQSWIADPYYVKKALDGAGVTPKDTSLKGLSKVFKPVAELQFASTYQIQYTGASEDEVRRVFASLHTVMNEATETINKAGDGFSMTVLFAEPTITTQSSGIPLAPIAGLVIGFLFAITTATLIERKQS